MSAHAEHTTHSEHGGSLNRVAALATLHCLTGCAIGEVLGMMIGTALDWSNAATIALAVFLAFAFGYSLTMLPLVRAGLAVAVALPLAFASDSFSIGVMEIVDNGVMLAIPGAMDATLANPLFWGALAFALAVAYVFAYPVNRYLIARGQGHAVVHQYHGHGGAVAESHDMHDTHHEMQPSDAHAGSGIGSPRKLILVGAAAMAVTIGVATGGALLVEPHDESTSDHAGSPAMGDEHEGAKGPAGRQPAGESSGLSVANAGYRLTLDKRTFVAGERAQLSFTVADEHGPVRVFDEHGGVRMHLIVVRRDLTGYQHLHPTLQADGSWRTPLMLREAGVYRAYADFERNGEKTVLGVDLFAGGDFTPAEVPPPSTAVDIGRYRVELDAHVEAGAEATLRYRVTRDGVPVEVEPYLGEGGHLVALRDGDLAYLHVHPLEEKTGEISFGATFPSAASYRLFLQFKDAGRVHTAPLTVRVGQGS